MTATNLVTSLLAERLLTFRMPDGDILRQQQAIHEEILARSKHLKNANFMAIHVQDLQSLFEAYDKLFFAGLCRQAIAANQLRFRFSTRMSRAGGKTTRFVWTTGEVSYEIAIACGLLFDGFGTNDRPISACGRLCANRLEALQRIFEHELVHLVEHICWTDSNCSAARFQDITARHFLHKAHTHQLITRKERAAAAGIRPGCTVSFFFEGKRFTGRVNRVTKRATVLVEDAEGQPYSDGRRYRTYYVPVEQLERAP
jgi:hypothetical protein